MVYKIINAVDYICRTKNKHDFQRLVSAQSRQPPVNKRLSL